MGKKSKAGGGRDFWDGLSGWKAVDVGDALLLGSEEYGFCGLEELDGSALGECLSVPAAPPLAPSSSDKGRTNLLEAVSKIRVAAFQNACEWERALVRPVAT